MRLVLLLGTIGVGTLIVWALFESSLSRPELESRLISTQTNTLEVTYADTPQERYRGLSDRKTLPMDEGLMLVYDTLARHGIVMRDMNFPIDIIWLDKSGKIVDFKRNASPQSYQSPSEHTTFKPEEPARYVLEVAAGVLNGNAWTKGTDLSQYLPN